MPGLSETELNKKVLDVMQDMKSSLQEAGYGADEITLLLTRIMICVFSDALNVFCGRSFYEMVGGEERGSFMHRLSMVFGALSGEPDAAFTVRFGELPVISRELFSGKMPERDAGAAFEELVMSCRGIAFGEISPAIFGALFQNVTDRNERRVSGAYYTNEENIDRLIDPLFMNDLLAERKRLKGNLRGLRKFHDKIAGISILDPACGCGNILLRAYERLRLLELDVLDELLYTGQRVMDVSLCCRISTLHFKGIELDPVEAGIARICMWLTKMKMDLMAADRFGIPDVLPDSITPMGIRVGNALVERWEEIAGKDSLSYIIGNPPYVGARLMTPAQKADMKMVFGQMNGLGNLDYVAAWYKKTAEFISGTDIRAAFVSTNSITQGEQASLLWKELDYKHDMEMDFAYRTFVWNNISGGAARVHCVIIGFSWRKAAKQGKKLIFDGGGTIRCRHINAYLTAGENVYINARRKPVSDVPEMVFGSMPNDGGNLILTAQEREELLAQAPQLSPVIRPYMGSEDYLKGRKRYCIWITGTTPSELTDHPFIQDRIGKVRKFREKSPRASTRLLALHADRFAEIRQPEEGEYLLVPRVSSVRREYIPAGFMDSRTIAGDAVMMVPRADRALFALLSSRVHMLFLRTVGGRLKSDLRYSAGIVYNNFPFPALSEAETAILNESAERILEVRNHFAPLAPAKLYDPDTMPDELKTAHAENDAAVEKIYGFTGLSDSLILSGLFELLR